MLSITRIVATAAVTIVLLGSPWVYSSIHGYLNAARHAMDNAKPTAVLLGEVEQDAKARADTIAQAIAQSAEAEEQIATDARALEAQRQRERRLLDELTLGRASLTASGNADVVRVNSTSYARTEVVADLATRARELTLLRDEIRQAELDLSNDRKRQGEDRARIAALAAGKERLYATAQRAVRRIDRAERALAMKAAIPADAANTQSVALNQLNRRVRAREAAAGFGAAAATHSIPWSDAAEEDRRAIEDATNAPPTSSPTEATTAAP
jgi:DNA repair exonuclease SbcCD ATPase subunit